METESGKKQHHFVLVHGVCHGAWCWYKVATLLSSAGHRVTALDMTACGARPGRAEEVPSFEEYSRPLLAAVSGLPPQEKAVLIGHSFGSKSLALAMEWYPDRVAVAVFVAAGMPAAGKPMTSVFEQLSQEEHPADRYMDCEFVTSGDPENPVETFRFGPQYLKQRLYQLSPPEDLTLAMATLRPSRRFLDDATMNGNVLTAERYGAVRRVCVVAEDDASLPAGFQRRMASWNPGTEVRWLQGADHMPMFSKSRELSELLMEVADSELRWRNCATQDTGEAHTRTTVSGCGNSVQHLHLCPNQHPSVAKPIHLASPSLALKRWSSAWTTNVLSASSRLLTDFRRTTLVAKSRLSLCFGPCLVAMSFTSFLVEA